MLRSSGLCILQLLSGLAELEAKAPWKQEVGSLPDSIWRRLRYLALHRNIRGWWIQGVVDRRWRQLHDFPGLVETGV